MKPKEEEIYLEYDNGFYVYWTGEIVEDKDGELWFEYTSKAVVQNFEDEEGRDMEAEIVEPFYYYVNVKDQEIGVDAFEFKYK